MRLAERGRVGDYVLFGLIAGLGLLSKYGFTAFILILLISAFLQPVLRRYFPKARIVCLRRPEYGPPVRPADFRERAAVVSRPSDAR